MITSTTSYKCAEIIRDTWPQLYRPAKVSYNNQKDLNNERISGQIGFPADKVEALNSYKGRFPKGGGQPIII